MSASPARRLLHLLAMLCLALAPLSRVVAEEKTEGKRGPGSILVFTGKAELTRLGPLGRQTVRLDIQARNPGTSPVEVRGGDVLLCHPGGWLTPLDAAAVDGSFFRGSFVLQPGETRAVAGQSHVVPTPATHMILRVDAADGPANLAIPILRSDYERPPACDLPGSFGVGVVGPLEAVPFSDGTSGVLLIGQHQVFAGARPQSLRTTVSVGSDQGALDPLTWDGLDAKGDRRVFWPFARRVQVFRGLERGRLQLSARADVRGETLAFSRAWPVQRVEPVLVRAPVLGRWQLSNGPGLEDVHDHYVHPQLRYAYDLVVLRQGRTYAGDPHDNASYYAWNRSIRAVADGRVVHVCDSERDNPGYRGSLRTCHDNRVVIEHADGLFTAYLHIRARSVPQGLNVEGAPVKAGQVIARVGNSGDSSEPHLHFMAFRIDASGRARSVPVAFRNAWHDPKGTKPVEGVPLAGHEYTFRSVP